MAVFLTPSNLRMDLRQCQAPPYVPRGDACSLTLTCSRGFLLSSALSGTVMGNALIREARPSAMTTAWYQHVWCWSRRTVSKGKPVPMLQGAEDE